MSERVLLTLRLHAPLGYRGLENPPFLGLRADGLGDHGLDFALNSEGSRDGVDDPGYTNEEVFLFEERDLIVFDPDDGPRLATELPSPFFYGRGLSKESIEADRKGSFLLIPGEYLFFQWRPKNEPELREGLEWFARESWWEDQKADGPYIVRRILEDKALATQVLRAIAR